ncbi:MAG TPA: hypothetical protein VLL54_20105 [Pyrinomonadaceae bacterium]|nr:hypothetical protein [Pyrinomonadaceae bacterium]
MKSLKTTGQMFLLALFTLAAPHFSAAVKAQDRNPGPEIVTRDTDFESRSNTLRNISEAKPGEKRVVDIRKDPKVVMDESREDYKYLQIDNKALKLTLETTPLVDPASVADFISDVRKRAERLSINLALPELDKKAERMKISPAASPEAFSASVSSLSGLIRSFVTNPCFREPALLVNEQTLKARADLEDMIAVTKQLQKDGEKLKKPSQP